MTAPQTSGLILSSSTPLTSLIVVTYHTGTSLFAALSSALQQTVPIELIIVDNGNPPEVMARLREIEQNDARIKLLTGHGNVGFGRANNLGVAIASGTCLLLLNPDCLLPPETIETMIRHLKALPPPAMIGARILNEDGTDQRGCRRELLTPTSAFVEALHLGRFLPKLRLNKHEEEVPRTITSAPAISGAFMFLSKDGYDHIGGFDEDYFLHVEDLDFCWRFRQAGGEIYFAPDVPVTHIGGTSAVSSDFIERCKARSFSKYFHKNFRGKYPLLFLWCLDISIWARYVLRRIHNRSASL